MEKAICANPSLAALDQRLADAYAKARARLDAPAQAALRDDQRTFLAARDAFFGTPDYDLASDLKDRIAWMDRIDPAAHAGWDGTWGSVLGEITLSGGGRKADIQTVALTRSHPTCMLESSAKLADGVLLVGADPADRKENEGWSVRLTLQGAVLRAELLPPADGDSAGGPPFCGHLASIAGAFLPLR